MIDPGLLFRSSANATGTVNPGMMASRPHSSIEKEAGTCFQPAIIHCAVRPGPLMRTAFE